MGPLAGALRTWRPMLTADLARIGPPAVAAAAAECGLGSSLVLPFDVDGDRVGVLQLLGEVQRPVEAAHAEMLRPLLDVLGARLADVRALRRAGLISRGREAHVGFRLGVWREPHPAEKAGSTARTRPSHRRGRCRTPHGAHAVPEARDLADSTTSFLPADLPRPGAPARSMHTGPVPPAAGPTPPRTGRHSA